MSAYGQMYSVAVDIWQHIYILPQQYILKSCFISVSWAIFFVFYLGYLYNCFWSVIKYAKTFWCLSGIMNHKVWYVFSRKIRVVIKAGVISFKPFVMCTFFAQGGRKKICQSQLNEWLCAPPVHHLSLIGGPWSQWVSRITVAICSPPRVNLWERLLPSFLDSWYQDEMNRIYTIIFSKSVLTANSKSG